MSTEYKTFRNIPYEKVLIEETDRTMYVCTAFHEAPYFLRSFSTVTEADMYRFIGHYLDNKKFYLERYELNDRAAEEFYSE